MRPETLKNHLNEIDGVSFRFESESKCIVKKGNQSWVVWPKSDAVQFDGEKQKRFLDARTFIQWKLTGFLDLPENHGKSWGSDSDVLLECIDAGMTMDDISADFKRTPKSIASKIASMYGVPYPELDDAAQELMQDCATPVIEIIEHNPIFDGYYIKESY